MRKALFRLLAFVCVVAPQASEAETMFGALARAYISNPALNQQRAGVRALDENVPKARAGWLPKVNATGYAGVSYLYQRDPPPPQTPLTRNPDAANDVGNALTFGQKYRSVVRGYGLSAQQTLFDGFATLNSLRQAESQVLQGREDLRGVEQDTLMSAAAAYMDVLRDTAVLGLRAGNIDVLKQQLGQTRALGAVGQATQTDVAQAEAALQQARSNYFGSRGALQASMAAYRQIVGVEPRALQPAPNVERLLPRSLPEAIERGQREHPAIASALQGTDAAAAGVKVAESVLYPTASITGAVSRDLNPGGMSGAKSIAAGLFAQINLPLYQGGGEYASIRQSKEQVGQARLMIDVQRNQVRAAVVSAWGQRDAANSQIRATQAAVKAAEVALAGVRSESLVGQRTTFDILTAQQALLNARVAHVQAQRDRTVASYSILAAIGRLTATAFGLTDQIFDATLHFEQVKDRLFGTGTP